MGAVCCQKLIVENAFHFHLFCISLVVKFVVLLGRVVEIIVISRGFTLNHGLQLITFLHQLLVEFLQLVSFSDQVFHLLSHGVNVVLLLVAHRIDLVTGDHLSLLVFYLQRLVLLA